MIEYTKVILQINGSKKRYRHKDKLISPTPSNLETLLTLMDEKGTWRLGGIESNQGSIKVFHFWREKQSPPLRPTEPPPEKSNVLRFQPRNKL